MSAGARLARTSDVDDLVAIQMRAWTAYGDLLPPLDAEELAAAWGDAIVRPPSPMHRVLVAVDGPDVVGYAAIAPADDAVGEVLDLVVDPAHVGHGHGSRLMAACIDHLREAGLTTAVTWLLADDEVRRRFFTSAGWGPDGASRTLGDGVREVRQVRLVTAFGDVH